MNLTFKLTSETKVNAWGVTLYRIEALVDLKWAKKGEKGGWVESEKTSNGNARVFGNAWVSGNAEVFGNARVSGNAEVSGNARVFGNAWVFGNAEVFGNAWVSLKKSYTKGLFLHTSDNDIKTTIIDQSKEEGFNSSEDYKNLLVVGDYEITDQEPKSDPETVEISGKRYRKADVEERLKELESL